MASAIAFALRQSETGTRGEQICRQLGFPRPRSLTGTAAAYRKKYGGMGVAELRKLRQLEEENAQLKKLVAEWFATAAQPGQANASGCD